MSKRKRIDGRMRRREKQKPKPRRRQFVVDLDRLPNGNEADGRYSNPDEYARVIAEEICRVNERLPDDTTCAEFRGVAVVIAALIGMNLQNDPDYLPVVQALDEDLRNLINEHLLRTADLEDQLPN